jgi:tRNA pseudouridine13 synthase
MGYTIKVNPEDFRVEEIPADLSRVEKGKYTILKIVLTNWETNHFVTHLARYLGMSRKRITYAGTKDKRAITTQYFCINGSVTADQIRIKDCEIKESFYVDKPLNLGDLKGNKFRIQVSEPEKRVRNAVEKIREISRDKGFWNLFGVQRFGTIRYNTHKVGKEIVKNGIENAVKEYLFDPDIDHEEFRLELGKKWDYAMGLKTYPEHLQFERALMSELVAGKTYEQSFDSLPKSLRMMFIHAYQSDLFNRILKYRRELTNNPFEIFQGDFISPVDELFNIEEGKILSVNEFNLERMQDLSRNGKIVPLAPLIGMETREQDGIPGTILKRVMNEENLKFSDFRIEEKNELSSRGNYRGIGFRPIDFSSDGTNILEFSLGRGIYATSLLDQVFESD